MTIRTTIRPLTPAPTPAPAPAPPLSRIRSAVGATMWLAVAALVFALPTTPLHRPLSAQPQPPTAGPEADRFPAIPTPATTVVPVSVFVAPMFPGAESADATVYSVARTMDGLIALAIDGAASVVPVDPFTVRRWMPIAGPTDAPAAGWAAELAAQTRVTLVVGGHVERDGDDAIVVRPWIFDARHHRGADDGMNATSAPLTELPVLRLELADTTAATWEALVAHARAVATATAAAHSSTAVPVEFSAPSRQLATFLTVTRARLAQERQEYEVARQLLELADAREPGLALTAVQRAELYLEVKSIDPRAVPDEWVQQSAQRVAEMIGRQPGVPTHRMLWTVANAAAMVRDAPTAELALLELLDRRPMWLSAWQTLFSRIKPVFLSVRYPNDPDAGIARILTAADALGAAWPDHAEVRLVVADTQQALGELPRALVTVAPLIEALGTARAVEFPPDVLRSAGYATAAWLRLSRQSEKAHAVAHRLALTFPTDEYVAMEWLVATGRAGMELLDKNNSRMLERFEVPDGALFAGADENGDGVLSPDEFLAYLPGLAQDPFRVATALAEPTPIVKLADSAVQAAVLAQAVAGPGVLPAVDRVMSSEAMAHRLVEFQRGLSERMAVSLADPAPTPTPERVMTVLMTWHLSQMLETVARGAEHATAAQIARFASDRIRAAQWLRTWRVRSPYFLISHDPRRDSGARFSADLRHLGPLPSVSTSPHNPDDPPSGGD